MQWVILTFVEPDPMVIETPVEEAIGPFASVTAAQDYAKMHKQNYKIIQLVEPEN
jgi:hypothetical protein